MKNKKIAMTLAVILSATMISLTSCGDTDSGTNADSLQQTTAVQQSTAPETTAQTESEAQSSEETTLQSEVQTSTEVQSTESQSDESSQTVQSTSDAENAEAIYNAVSSYRAEMEKRGTKIDGNLNFEFNLSDPTADENDPKTSPEEEIKRLAQNAVKNCEGYSVYVGLSDTDLFIQTKNADGVITQSPAAAGNITWGVLS